MKVNRLEQLIAELNAWMIFVLDVDAAAAVVTAAVTSRLGYCY